jgi:CBS domain-containing protein
MLRANPRLPMNVPISALLQRKGAVVHSVAPHLSIYDAVAEMNRLRIGAIVILDDGRLAGIFTERDALRRVLGAGIDPKAVRVSEVMTSDVITVAPEATVEEVAQMFTDKRCRHLPVVSGDRLVGLISIGDISRWVADHHRAEAEYLKNYIAGGLHS